MKRLIKNIIYGILANFDFSGAIILMYHSISDSDYFFSVKPSDFSKQMEYLKEKEFNVVPLKHIFKKMKEGRKRLVAITFDDGYQDNYSQAYPLLKKYNFPATIFITTSLIGKVDPKRKFSMLTEPQIKEMANNGLIDFGAHTETHPRLTRTEPLEAVREIKNSQDTLKVILNKPIELFAYPYGDYNASIEEIVKKYFKQWTIVGKGRVRPQDDPFSLKRNSIDKGVNFTEFKGIVKFGRL